MPQLWNDFVAWFSPPRRRRPYWDQPIEVVAPLTPAGLDQIYGEVTERIFADAAFLRRPIAMHRELSGLVKVLAWLLFAAGVLLPILVTAEKYRFLGAERSGTELALIAVVTGGLILLLDQLFNLSRSWQRLMLSELQVRKIHQALAMEWQKRRGFVTDVNMPTEGVAMIELLATALRDTHEVMLTQKQAWTSELDQAMADLRANYDMQRGSLDKLVQAQKAEAAKPTTGALNIAIDKPGDLAGEVVLLVDGKEAGKWPAPDSALSVGNVPAGLRVVEVRGKRKAPPGAVFTFAQSVKVDGGAGTAFQVKVS